MKQKSTQQLERQIRQLKLENLRLKRENDILKKKNVTLTRDWQFERSAFVKEIQHLKLHDVPS